MGRIKMKHYITPDNNTWGFDDTQTHLIPSDAKVIPDSYEMDQLKYLQLINGQIVFNQTAYNEDKVKNEADKLRLEQKENTRRSALAKLTALGLSEDEISSLGV